MRPIGPGDDPSVFTRLVLPDEAAETAVYARSLELHDFGERNLAAHLARGVDGGGGPAAVIARIRRPGTPASPTASGVRWTAAAATGRAIRTDEVTAELDLGPAQPVWSVKLSFLQHPGSGVYFPRRVEVATSVDGQSWSEPVDAGGPESGRGGGKRLRRAAASESPWPSKAPRRGSSGSASRGLGERFRRPGPPGRTAPATKAKPPGSTSTRSSSGRGVEGPPSGPAARETRQTPLLPVGIARPPGGRRSCENPLACPATPSAATSASRWTPTMRRSGVSFPVTR